MRGHVEVHFAQLIVGANQVVFLVPGQVAQVDDAELAKTHDHADGAGVLRNVVRALLGGGA